MDRLFLQFFYEQYSGPLISYNKLSVHLNLFSYKEILNTPVPRLYLDTKITLSVCSEIINS